MNLVYTPIKYKLDKVSNNVLKSSLSLGMTKKKQNSVVLIHLLYQEIGQLEMELDWLKKNTD